MYFHNADIVLCPHGAASANALFMRGGGMLIEACPCNWSAGSSMVLIIAEAKKLIYRQLVEPSNSNPEERTGQFRDYAINNSMLEYAMNEFELVESKYHKVIESERSLCQSKIDKLSTMLENEKKKSKVELDKIEKQLKLKQMDLLNIQNSLSYRIGRIITFIPRKIHDLFKKKNGGVT